MEFAAAESLSIIKRGLIDCQVLEWEDYNACHHPVEVTEGIVRRARSEAFDKRRLSRSPPHPRPPTPPAPNHNLLQISLPTKTKGAFPFFAVVTGAWGNHGLGGVNGR